MGIVAAQGKIYQVMFGFGSKIQNTSPQSSASHQVPSIMTSIVCMPSGDSIGYHLPVAAAAAIALDSFQMVIVHMLSQYALKKELRFIRLV